MEKIKLSNVTIDIHQGPTGILASGGVDSSILLYFLITKSNGPLHIFTGNPEAKQRQNGITVSKIINFILSLHPRQDIFHHIYYYSKDKDFVLPNLRSYFPNEFFYIYSGITANPASCITDSFKTKVAEHIYVDRNPMVTRPEYSERMVYNHKINFYKPFTNLDKKQIYLIYKECNLLDSLFKITRSCESFSLIEGHCGECWWCEERYWGFNKL